MILMCPSVVVLVFVPSCKLQYHEFDSPQGNYYFKINLKFFIFDNFDNR